MVKLVVGKGGLPPLLFCQSMLTFSNQSGGKPPFPTTSLLHVSRITHHASRITHDISRITGVFAMITRLSQEEARALLTVSRVGRLGCVYEGGPYVVPINYVLDGRAFMYTRCLDESLRRFAQTREPAFRSTR